MFPLYSTHPYEFGNPDVQSLILPKMPSFSVVCANGPNPIGLWVQPAYDLLYTFQTSTSDDSTLAYTGIPTLVSDTVTEV